METQGSSFDAATRSGASRQRLLSLIDANWTTQAVSVATELGLPELLRHGPRTAGALALATSCHEPSLARLLRALTSIGVLTKAADGRFELTSVGVLLLEDVPGSLAAWAEFCGTRSWATWGRLVQSIRTGDSVRKQTSGADGFHHLEDDAQGALLFNRAMVNLTQPLALAFARNLDPSGVALVVDVGGGYGELIASILRQHTSMRGVLFDLAHATAVAESHLTSAGVEDRCTVVTGSFFDAVPAGADAYLLKSVLHDWDDDCGVQILRNCHEAMPPDARMFVIERIAPEHFGDSPHDQGIARSDLNMLVGTGGRERTEAQYRELLAEARLRITNVLELGGPYSMIEAAPA